MPPKSLHEQDDNDTGEGSTNVKKIRILRDDDDDGIMCETCSQVLDSTASLAWPRHKKSEHGNETEV